MSVINGSTALYADDTILYCCGDSVETVTVALQEDLTCVSTWLNANKLSLNVSKTKAMVFHTIYYRGSLELNLNISNEPVGTSRHI